MTITNRYEYPSVCLISCLIRLCPLFLSNPPTVPINQPANTPTRTSDKFDPIISVLVSFLRAQQTKLRGSQLLQLACRL
jgi:hypothetical protein